MEIVRGMVYIVICMFLPTKTKGDDGLAGDNFKEYCRFKGNMCDVETACFKKLWDNYSMEDCESLEFPKMSLYVDQSLSFEPSNYDRRYMPENLTYSVFISDIKWNEELRLVPGCCNLDSRKNDTCRMPATFNKTKRFFAVFPYRDDLGSKPSIYCRMEVQYANLPVEFCVEGEEIIDPCLTVSEDGGFRIKYRYTPLSDDVIKEKQMNTSRCYFPLSADIMPKDKAYPERGFTQNEKGFIVMKPPETAIVRKVSEHDCTLHEEINGLDHLKIVTNIHNAQGGEFVCCGIKQIHDDSKYYNQTFCTNMQILAPSVLPIALPISAFLVLLAFIAGVQCCRAHGKFRKMADDWKKSSSLRFLMGHDKEEQENRSVSAVNEEPKREEFCEVIPDMENIHQITTISKISSMEIENSGDHQVELKPPEPMKIEGEYILKDINGGKLSTSGLSDDSGFSNGTSVDLGQYCKNTTNEISSESPYPNSGDSGYMTKTLVTDTPNRYGDSHSDEGIVSVDAAMNSDNFSSGYTPKYITKHITASSVE